MVIRKDLNGFEEAYRIAEQAFEDIVRNFKKYAFVDNPNCIKYSVRATRGRGKTQLLVRVYSMLYVLLRLHGFRIVEAHQKIEGRRKTYFIICKDHDTTNDEYSSPDLVKNRAKTDFPHISTRPLTDLV